MDSLKHILSSLIFIWAIVGNGQTINYNTLVTTAPDLKNSLLKNSDYFSGGNSELPYFQGKFTDSYIKFYKSTGTVVTFDLKSQEEYVKLIREIQQKAIFRFKFCLNYDEPVVYNYETSNGNKLRFNFSEMRISVEYPSKINSLLDRNSGLTSVFVCLSENAYAYHTNLKCEGLGNCESDIAKSNMTEAKKYNYSFCEICTSDNY